MDAAKQAPALVLQMGPIARDVCIALGDDLLGKVDAAEKVSQATCSNFAPDALKMIYQDVAPVLQLKARRGTWASTWPSSISYDGRLKLEWRAGPFRKRLFPFGICRMHPCHQTKNRWFWPLYRGGSRDFCGGKSDATPVWITGDQRATGRIGREGLEGNDPVLFGCRRL